MRTDTLICTQQKKVLETYYDIAWPEVFDIMLIDEVYAIDDIASKMECFAHYSERSRRDYTKVILQEMVREQEEQGTYQLIKPGQGKWVAPSLESEWHKTIGVVPVEP